MMSFMVDVLTGHVYFPKIFLLKPLISRGGEAKEETKTGFPLFGGKPNLGRELG